LKKSHLKLVVLIRTLVQSFGDSSIEIKDEGDEVSKTEATFDELAF
jgi:hypothetical protein